MVYHYCCTVLDSMVKLAVPGGGALKYNGGGGGSLKYNGVHMHDQNFSPKWGFTSWWKSPPKQVHIAEKVTLINFFCWKSTLCNIYTP